MVFIFPHSSKSTYSVPMRENTDRKDSEYGLFLRCDSQWQNILTKVRKSSGHGYDQKIKILRFKFFSVDRV